MDNTVKNIAGTNGLTDATNAQIDTYVAIPADVGSPLQTRKLTPSLLRRALGAIGFATTGDVSGSGFLGSFTLNIGDGKVTYSKIGAVAANSVIGNPLNSAATPRALALNPDDFVLVGDTIHAAAAASADDAESAAIYFTVPGAL